MLKTVLISKPWIYRVANRLFKASLWLLLISFITVTIIVLGYPSAWDDVELHMSRSEVESICGPADEDGAWPEKQLLWRYGTKYIYWDYRYSYYFSRTSFCFWEHMCTDIKVDQSYEKGILRQVKNQFKDWLETK